MRRRTAQQRRPMQPRMPPTRQPMQPRMRRIRRTRRATPRSNSCATQKSRRDRRLFFAVAARARPRIGSEHGADALADLAILFDDLPEVAAEAVLVHLLSRHAVPQPAAV